MADLISGIAKLNPFSRKSAVDDDDKGEAIDATTVAGGGHASRRSHITKDKLRVSQTLKTFIVQEGILGEPEVGLNMQETTMALRELLDKSHIKVPPQCIDRRYPLPEYFISSSHNTYLMAHQLFGESHASAYEIALQTGSRCVEIDAWDNDDNRTEPKVTHGFTLVSNIPFRTVCETIRDVVDREAADERNAAPIMISLENHCDALGQKYLAQIMCEVFGSRLLSKAMREKGAREQEGTGEHVTLAELGNKIVVIVEYHLPDEEESSDSDSSSEDEAERQAHQQYNEKRKATNAGLIIPELAELGVYAQSVKPVNNSWFEADLDNAPHHQLINVSESGLKKHLPINSAKVARHNSHHLMRVYPKGTRISSRNLAPVPFWGIGAQICALNWQTFGASSQINEALFAGSGGYVLKPAALRAGGDGNLNTGKRRRLRLHAAGATDIPIPTNREHDDIKPYLTCTLVHPNDMNNIPPKRKTTVYKSRKLTSFTRKETSPANDPIWNEVLEWEYEDNELVFLRLLVKSDDSYSRNPVFAVAAVRLMYAIPGWSFIRMLDLGGHETTCTLLVRFEFQDA
ncbi:PLC-like phosphodiesterase [Dothidotthia symphoricarpi CBS 119687]|uniref:Phosphoinositide phospholipase C n=1 Tax=Dothidotthia symphoricarpi CBS 119687 TaxID=1392245 RepID=A0A6A6A5Y3_9PLEO|nr:PLC-like phosphodiesterase [Dothidotthia symphoricarpi CBS 119687]KAF2126494.1 PLC-like phosphodiesterase [Dothidotthia symphoricarpi CBS 119687]